MATLPELIADIASARDRLHAAIEGAAGGWEDATLPPEADEVNPNSTGDPWTPKQAATHAIGAAGFFSSILGAGIGVLFTPKPTEIETSEEALAAFDAAFEAVDTLVAKTTEDTLELPAPVPEVSIGYAATRGHEIGQNVTGALTMIAIHTADHAEQIVRGTATD